MGSVVLPPTNTATIRAVGEIRSSLGIYLAVLGINLFSALLFGVAALFSGHPVGLGESSFISCNGSSFVTSQNGISSALSTAGSAFGIIAFILLIIAWLRWRSGVRRLEESRYEYGYAHTNEAVASRRYYGYTVWSYVLVLLITIVGVGVIVSITVSTLSSAVTPNGVECTQQLADQLNSQLLYSSAGLAVAVAFANVLVYWFATRSLGSGINSLSSPTIRQELASARSIVLIGVIVAFGGVLVLLSIYFQLFALVSVALLVVGYLRFYHAYGAWLRDPPPPAPPPPTASVLPSPALWGPPGSPPG